MTETILVTGAGGFVGRPLVAAAATQGFRVIATARRPLPGWQGDVETVIGDLGDLVAGGRLPAASIVIHAAATSPAEGIGSRHFASDNVASTSALADYCQRVKPARVIYLSSLSALGRISVPVVDETTPSVDPGPYGLSKLMGEHLLAETGCPLATLRLPGVVGPAAARPWLARLVRTALEGATLTITNPEAAFNNAVHLDDLVPFLLRLARHDALARDCVTLGSSGTMTIRRVAERVAMLAGRDNPIRCAEGGLHPFIISSRRAIEQHGWVDMGIEQLVDRLVADLGGATPRESV